MRCRFVPLVALLGLTAVPIQALAQEEAPSLIVRVRSIDSLMNDAKYLLAQVGQEELGKQIDGFIKSQVGAKGLEGIDTKRPLGFYGTVGPNGVDSTGVLLIPVSDEKAFVTLLDRLNLGVKKNDDGTYNIAPPNSPTEGYFRIANKYCYLTAMNKSAIDKGKLLDPATVLPENLTAAFSATVRFDRIPDSIKQVALSQFELKLADEQDKKVANETESQHKFRIALLKHFSERMKQLFGQGQALTFRFDIDRKSNEMSVDLSLTGKPGSKLEKDIAEVGQSKSLFAGSIGANSAMSLLVHASLPAEIQKALGPVIDEAIRQGLEKDKDEARRENARKFLDVLAPTLKSGEFDFIGSMRGPTAEKHYALLVGVKVKDGKAIDQAFRDMVKTFKEEEQNKIKFDAETVAGIKVHRFDITKKDIDERAQALFGPEPLYLAIKPDAALFAFGEGGLAALKEALTAKPQEGPAFQAETSIKRLATAMERENQKLGKLVEEAFADGKDNDRIRLAVEGGKALKMRFTMKSSVMKFFSLLAEAKKAE